jgi:hypothetical protein
MSCKASVYAGGDVKWGFGDISKPSRGDPPVFDLTFSISHLRRDGLVGRPHDGDCA